MKTPLTCLKVETIESNCNNDEDNSYTSTKANGNFLMRIKIVIGKLEFSQQHKSLPRQEHHLSTAQPWQFAPEYP